MDNLSDAFSSYEGALNTHKAEVQQKESKLDAFMQKFEELATTIIKPALEEVLQELTKHGHSGKINANPYSPNTDKPQVPVSSIELRVLLKDVEYRSGGDAPHIAFIARGDRDNTSLVLIHHNFISSGTLKTGGHLRTKGTAGGGKQYELEDITFDLAKEETADYVIELLKSCKI